MHTTPEFPELLRLIDERAEAFRAALSSAPDLNAQVPTCPDWTLRDLARHLGSVHRMWAAVVAAGPADTRPDQDIEPGPEDRQALVAWSAESTRALLDALREAGPDRGCWTWWDAWQSPRTAAGVARHQVQEAAVHTYDAQNVASTAPPLPPEAAVDGVEEFLATCCATTCPWPHQPASIDFHVTEGPAWRLTLSDAGAHVSPLPDHADSPTVSTRSTAGELVLALYNRLPFDALTIDGERQLLDQLKEWEPDY